MDRNDYCISVACFVTGFGCNCQTQNKNVYWMMQPLWQLGDNSVMLFVCKRRWLEDMHADWIVGQYRYWEAEHFLEQFLLQESSVFFVGLWPYCGGCPISVTGEATTDTTGSHINSKQKQDPSNALVVNYWGKIASVNKTERKIWTNDFLLWVRQRGE